MKRLRLIGNPPDGLELEVNRYLDRINELREFEREYRSRLIAYHEEALCELREPKP